MESMVSCLIVCIVVLVIYICVLCVRNTPLLEISVFAVAASVFFSYFSAD